MALVLADGQLSASAATVLGTAGVERIVAVTLYNTMATEQTVSLTVTRSGSTARTIVRGVLKEKESLYVQGLPLDPSDVLAGSATSAAVVDYLVTASAGQFAIFARDKNGAPKASVDVTLETTEKIGLTYDGIVLSGQLEEIRNLLMKIA